MSVVIKDASVIVPLWNHAASTPSTGWTATREAAAVRLQPSGQFLCLTVDKHAAVKPSSSKSGSSNRGAMSSPVAAEVTVFLFHPAHHTKAALALSDGTVYGMDLSLGQLFLLGHFAPDRITAMCFVTAHLGSGLLCTTSKREAFAVDWESGRRLQQWSVQVHPQPVELILMDTLSAASVVLCRSSDVVSCWSWSTRHQSSSPPAYRCSFLALAHPIPASSFAPCVAHEGALGTFSEAALTSRGVATAQGGWHLSCWALPSHRLTETNGLASPRTSTALQHLRTVRLPFRFSCLTAVASGLLVVSVEEEPGDTPAQTTCSPRGLAVLDVETLQGIHRVRFQHGPSAGPCVSLSAMLPPANTLLGALQGPSLMPPDETPIMALLQGNVMAASFANGSAVLVELSSGRCVTEWDLQGLLQSTDLTTISLRKSSPLACETNPSTCLAEKENPSLSPTLPRLLLAPTTYAAVVGRQHVLFLHLLTSKQQYQQVTRLGDRNRYTEVVEEVHRSSLGETPHWWTPLNGQSGMDENRNRVVLFLEEPLEGERAKRKPEFAYRVGSPPPFPAFAMDSSSTGVVESVSHRPVLSLEPKYFSQWVDASEVDLTQEWHRRCRPVDDEHQHTLTNILYAMDDSQAENPSRAFALNYACNVQKLREYLRRYGCFPFPHRPLLWRFALGLPDAVKTAPMFASLARKPPHPCVAVVMEGYPLPPSKAEVSQRLETAISVLAWHSPVFSVLQCLPALLYPWAHVVKETQALVELAMLFFLNWGKDFFSYHPQAPPDVMTFIAQLLRREDPQLFQHLEAIGSPVEVWGWEVLQVLYTDALTASEWLQLMDHMFMMVPLWLLVFHVCLLKGRRDVLLQCTTSLAVLQTLQDSAERYLEDTVALPKATARFSISTVIQETYRVYQQHHLPAQTSPHHRVGSETAPVPHISVSGSGSSSVPSLAVPNAYTYFQSLYTSDESEECCSAVAVSPFSPQYPSKFPCDAAVLRERIKDMELRSQRLKEMNEIQRRRAEEDNRAHVDALAREYILQQAQNLLYAKYDAAAEAFQSKVQLQKMRESVQHAFCSPLSAESLPAPLSGAPHPHPALRVLSPPKRGSHSNAVARGSTSSGTAPLQMQTYTLPDSLLLSSRDAPPVSHWTGSDKLLKDSGPSMHTFREGGTGVSLDGRPYEPLTATDRMQTQLLQRYTGQNL